MKVFEIKGQASDGTIFTIHSLEVQKRLALFPEDSLEHALGVVVDLYNKQGTIEAYSNHNITKEDLELVPLLKDLGFKELNTLLVHKNETLEDAAKRLYEQK